MIYSGEGDAYGSFEDLPGIVEEACDQLTQVADRFDFIATRGISGVVVATPVSLTIKKPLTVVRKPADGSHDQKTVVNAQSGRYIFLDDFISTGATQSAVIDAIASVGGATHVGDYLYGYSGSPLRWEPTPEKVAVTEVLASDYSKYLQPKSTVDLKGWADLGYTTDDPYALTRGAIMGNLDRSMTRLEI